MPMALRVEFILSIDSILPKLEKRWISGKMTRWSLINRNESSSWLGPGEWCHNFSLTIRKCVTVR